jgi:hypothetical protein
MKKLWLVLVVCSLCGCAHQYVVKMTNGMQVTSASKPKLKGSYYYYKGPHGEEQVISQSRVTEIEPASMAAEEHKFKVSQPKKKHWYWPF